MADAEVRMYIEKVLVTVGQATDEALKALAFAMQAQAQANIRSNGQIDTGFMVNSVYVISADGKAGDNWQSGDYLNESGQTVRRELADQPALGDAAAAVVVGANYAVYQEAENSFLYRAGEQVAGQASGTVEPVYRERVHD